MNTSRKDGCILYDKYPDFQTGGPDGVLYIDNIFRNNTYNDQILSFESENTLIKDKGRNKDHFLRDRIFFRIEE